MSKLLYGSVIVVSGIHKGKIGYYDDDDGDMAVVYFGVPFLSTYVLIQQRHLINSECQHIPTEALKKSFPQIVSDGRIF